ncbi:30S ribosomal protein S17 domain protein [Gardnerella vaginalis JCP8151B]|nr:30S ribosomal protein S17 domain protein [Gardnerella vaginalis JCP8151B]
MYQNPHKFGTKPGKSFERGYAKLGRDSRFFAADEANLSAEGGDSLKQQEKSRISVIKATQKS